MNSLEVRENIPDNKNGIPLEIYREQFRTKDPEEMSARSGVLYEDGYFKNVICSRPVTLSFPEMTAVFADTNEPAPANINILLARLVMEGSFFEQTGNFLAYTEMPWGEVYSAQFNGRCIKRMAFSYGFNLDKFERACAGVGGKPSGKGDKSFDIEFLKGFTLRLIIWEGDDEFPPASQILFSDNFQFAFKAEDMAVVGDIVLNMMKSVK